MTPETQTSAPALVVFNGDEGSNGLGLTMHNGSGAAGMQVCVMTGGSQWSVTTGYTLTAGTTYHVGVTVSGSSGSSCILYVNGVSVGTGTATFTAPTGNIKVGGNGSGNGFKGVIEDVIFQNGALSAASMLKIYQEKVKYGWIALHANTTFYWPMDDGPDGTSADGVTIRDRKTGTAEDLVGDNGANNTGCTFVATRTFSYR
jgi:hypothetical protein